MNEEHTNILIVEDDDFLRSLAVSKLQKEGLTVDVAEDGEVGLMKLEAKKYDVLVLDLMLPHVDGFEILRRLPTLPNAERLNTIVFSNLGSDDEIQRALSLGAEEYMIKSNFTLDELVEKVMALMPEK